MNLGTAAPSPTPVATTGTSSQSISSSGGTVSVALNGQTVNVVVPPGAFSSATTVTVSVYNAGTGPNKTQAFARKAQTLQAGDTELLDVVIDSGSAQPQKPLTLNTTGVPAPAAGSSARIEGFNGSPNGTFDDVATLAYASGAYTENADPTFPGLTLASKTEYVIYTHPGTGASGDGTVTVTPASATVQTGSTQQFTATEATANGFPYLQRAFSYALDNASAGTIDPNSGLFTAGSSGGTANVTATDKSVTTRKASAKVVSTSSRPNQSGATATFTGSVTETILNNNIAATPVPSVSTYAVSTTVTTGAADSNGNAVFTAKESDASALRTVTTTTTTTVAYQSTANGTNVRTLNTSATDSNGVSYSTTYGANNGLTAVLPETNGSFSNDASLEYKEIDPGIPFATTANGSTGASIDRIVNADGTYTQYNGALYLAQSTPATNVAKEYPNFSGEYDLISISPGGRFFQFNPPSGTTITFKYINNFSGTPTTTNYSSPNWIPASQTQPSIETDTVTTGVALDPSCAPAAAFGTTATQVKQTITTVDSVLGTLETKTTTSYDVAGPGTICTVVSDSIGTFYDFSVQEGPSPRITVPKNATTPVESITVAETLSLQSSSVATSSSNRAVKSLGQGMIIPRSLVLSRVEHLVHQKALRRLSALRSNGGSAQ